MIIDCVFESDYSLFCVTPGTPFRAGQEHDLKEALRGTDAAIPLLFVSGNHDLGNTPTPETVAEYCRAWGDDYFGFWVGGVRCLVLNSQLYFDASACPSLRDAQDAWLEEQLQSEARAPSRHLLVFQHIPLYLRRPDEDDDYFNMQAAVRESLIQRFKKAGRATQPPPQVFLYVCGLGIVDI